MIKWNESRENAGVENSQCCKGVSAQEILGIFFAETLNIFGLLPFKYELDKHFSKQAVTGRQWFIIRFNNQELHCKQSIYSFEFRIQTFLNGD